VSPSPSPLLSHDSFAFVIDSIIFILFYLLLINLKIN
jgi:hypothetical protein